MENREGIIVRTSIIGIIANVFLASFKAVIGALSGSIAIVLDAVNNLSDALSSVITIIGAKYAHKKPDREHPLGHGRAEYLSSAIISVIILYAGVTAAVESVKKIMEPTEVSYTMPSIVILIVAVFVKIILGTYVKKTGEKVNSDSLIGSGKDALLDAVISTSTVIAAVIFITTGFSVEAYLAFVIALYIIKSGYDLLSDTFADILGKRPEGEMTRTIKNIISEYPQVHGVYDLILHNYGPEDYMGSVHIEVDDTLTATDIEDLARDITHPIYERYGVILEAVGIYSRCTTNEEIANMRKNIADIVYGHDHVLQMHGFRADESKKIINADIIIGFDAPDREALYTHIVNDIKEEYPDWQIKLVMDIDASD